MDNGQTPGGNTTTAGAVEQLAPEPDIIWSGTEDEQHAVRLKVCKERCALYNDDDCDRDGSCSECDYDMAEELETRASLRRRVAYWQARAKDLDGVRAENDRLTKAVGSGILGELLNDEETDEFVKFIKFLRGQSATPAEIAHD